MTLVTSSVQLYLDYKQELKIIEDHQIRIREIGVAQMSVDLWEFDWPKVNLELKGLLNYPEIEYTYVLLNDGERVAKGTPVKHSNSDIVKYSLSYNQRELGDLFIQINYNYIYDRLLSKGLNILITQAINTFLISIAILYLVHHLITRHLYNLASFTERLSLDSLDSEPFKLRRKYKDDELQAVIRAINHMKSTLKIQLERKKEIEQDLLNERTELAKLNFELEHKVEERTVELKESNQELSDALIHVNDMIVQLQSAQKELIIQEKMLATGSMVVGLAHELNTPLGVCKTSVSAIVDFINQVNQSLESGQLSKNFLEEQLEGIVSLAQMSEDNIDRISAMIETFKELSVQRDTIEAIEEISLTDFFKDCSQWAGNSLRGGITFHIRSTSDLTIETFRSSLVKVIESLISNAATHAFPEDEPGHIYLEASEVNNKRIISVSDNGCGIPPKDQKRIFEPFYTTKRNKGGLGLGLNIVYNIVTQGLAGDIECKQGPEGGTCFEITLPEKLSNSELSNQTLNGWKNSA